MEPHLSRDSLTRTPGQRASRVRDPGPAALQAAARAQAGPGLYVHVPFCSVRCHYCDFSSGSLSSQALRQWQAALENEMEARAPLARGVVFRSVFFGGGTPSALAARDFTQVWNGLRSRFTIAPEAEVTLEANPESVRSSLLQAWRAAGVNRLSLGAQSFEAAELESLGRIRGPDRARQAVAEARAAGFANLSLDLMFGFPGHALAPWRRTLQSALALKPDHLSAYCYIPEEGTPMGDAVHRRTVCLPRVEEQEAMYRALGAAAKEAGLARYEISNFARPGFASRHNLGYWLCRDYLAFGPAAHSLWRGRRWGNVYSASQYAERVLGQRSPVAESEDCSLDSSAEEALFLGLRLAGGLCLADYSARLAAHLLARYRAALEAAAERGLLFRTRGGYRMAERRWFVADEVLAWILAEAERSRGKRALAGIASRGPHPNHDGRVALTPLVAGA